MKRNIMPIAIAWKQGWRVLAGPFAISTSLSNPLFLDDESKLAEDIMSFIESEGGRVAYVLSDRHTEYRQDVACLDIWRPGSEMETVLETEARLKNAKLKKQSNN